MSDDVEAAAAAVGRQPHGGRGHLIVLTAAVAKEGAIVLAEIVVHAPINLVGIVLRSGRAIKVADGSGKIRIGIQIDGLLSHRVKAVRRNQIAGKWIADKRRARSARGLPVIEGPGPDAEIPTLVGRRGNS